MTAFSKGGMGTGLLRLCFLRRCEGTERAEKRKGENHAGAKANFELMLPKGRGGEGSFEGPDLLKGETSVLRGG